jgi:hypothetical protein
MNYKQDDLQQNTTDPWASPWMDPNVATGGGQPDPSATAPVTTSPSPAPPVLQPGAGDTATPPAGGWGAGVGDDFPGMPPGTPPPGPGGYTSDLGPQGAPTAPGPTPSPSPGAGAVSSYTSLLDAVRNASDPTSSATARDALARQLQSDLEADGHTVKWNNDGTLSIDGRPYELGGDPNSWPVPTASKPGGANQTGYLNPDGTAGGYFDTPTGGFTYDQNHAPTNLPAGYAWDPKLAAIVKSGGGAASTTGGGNAQQALMQLLGSGMDPQQAINQINQQFGLGTGQSAVYYPPGAHGPGSGAVIGIAGYGGYFAQQPDGSWGWTESAEQRGGGGANGGGNAMHIDLPDISGWLKQWSPSAPTYTPNFIDASASDLPGFDELYSLAGGDPATDAKTDDLFNQIAANPTGLSDRDVEALKAANAEEAAAAAQSSDEELQHFGANANLGDSPWLAGQRATNNWNAKQAIIGSNRNVDLSAAQTRSSNLARSASLEQGYSQFKTSRQQARVNLALEGAVQKAGEQRSRTALNESLKQAATQLGLSKDQLVLGYIQGNMNYISQMTGHKIDASRLAEQSKEFADSLAQRIAELKQADDQFKANYGLAVQQFQELKNNNAWAQAKQAYNLS